MSVNNDFHGDTPVATSTVQGKNRDAIFVMGNVMGAVGIVFGLLACLVAFIPVIGVAAIPFTILCFLLSFTGAAILFFGRRAWPIVPGIGIGFAVLAIIILILVNVLFVSAVASNIDGTKNTAYTRSLNESPDDDSSSLLNRSNRSNTSPVNPWQQQRDFVAQQATERLKRSQGLNSPMIEQSGAVNAKPQPTQENHLSVERLRRLSMAIALLSYTNPKDALSIENLKKAGLDDQDARSVYSSESMWVHKGLTAEEAANAEYGMVLAYDPGSYKSKGLVTVLYGRGQADAIDRSLFEIDFNRAAEQAKRNGKSTLADFSLPKP
ncbi:MAG: hypothetical protein KatS3mg104_2283 [Phycisphaerae bacterium]|jgi:hypothetical protein|nr:MAG: hypothetical protein KatS3mg104_2283 [Phycisphaerae bacterium]